ncbi:hypothetical protein E2C01_052890 [Portunus trituberculatus]|uniref:Uncharacterized protein n=1 Tax=Portunus trituberculatus TaxID=210409 RepID=A0A5B7GEZ6_PORTR|nr:hypothetical protein [Portunus trituberculatus]
MKWSCWKCHRWPWTSAKCVGRTSAQIVPFSPTTAAPPRPGPLWRLSGSSCPFSASMSVWLRVEAQMA